ncbi:unnamed protein product [marine sediment metagenome]|uniref:Uncharacterized protein n=1 Tax=marine sediment metagenome TaxID=412755 RepID=X1AV02_9ZZZZ
MNRKRKIILLIFILFLFSIFYIGCESILPGIPTDSGLSSFPSTVDPKRGEIIIENGDEITKDCTPILTIYSEGAAYMSFSGDGVTWTDWIEYTTSYDKFNIANGLNGTIFGSGTKKVYVCFKDEEGNLSPSDKLAFDTVEYEMGEFFSVKISPREVTIPVNSSYLFTLHGYDLKLNEVPLDGSKVTWTECCGVGDLSPTTGLSTTYTAPSVPGKRKITAHYNRLGTEATIFVIIQY